MKYHGVQFTRLMSRNELAANIIMEYCPGKAAAARALVIVLMAGCACERQGRSAPLLNLIFATTGGDLEQFCVEHGLCTLDDTTRCAGSAFGVFLLLLVSFLCFTLPFNCTCEQMDTRDS